MTASRDGGSLRGATSLDGEGGMRIAERLRQMRIGDSRALRLVLVALLLAVTFAQPVIRLQRPRFEMIVVLDVTQSMDVQTRSSRAARSRAWHSPARRCATRSSNCHAARSSAGRSSPSTAASCCSRRSRSRANRAELRATLEGIDNRMAWTGSSEIAKGLAQRDRRRQGAARRAVAGVRQRRARSAAAESAASACVRRQAG